MSGDRPYGFVAPVAPGLEPLLVAELQGLGATSPTALRQAVAFDGDLELGYRVCLWSRLASRLLLRLGSFGVVDGDSLYAGAREAVQWLDHLGPDDTLALDADGLTAGLDNSHYAALRVKDAIVDQLRDRTGKRPTIDTQRPDIRVHLYLRDGQATVSLDLAGALHRRGYRNATAAAPLKENLAAGLLLMADWPARAAAGEPFVDPMCGSGTLAIEAALIAADVAPGLLPRHAGFEHWRGHDPELWRRLRQDARSRDRRDREATETGVAGAPPEPTILGFDRDPRAVQLANRAINRARVQDWVRVEQREFAEASPPQGTTGLVLFNPPYGKRLGQTVALKPLYLQIGRHLRQHFGGWTAGVLSGEPELSACLGLKATKKHAVYNGTLSCRLLIYPLRDDPPRRASTTNDGVDPALLRLTRSAGAQTLANRLRKNARHFGRWARRSAVSCYRIYDADLPEYAAAIDLYEHCAHVQEYAPPPQVDDTVADERLHDIVLLTAALLEVSPQQVHLKVRRRQRGSDQYQAAEEPQRAIVEVTEGGHRFVVNLSDYLDTGLFLDQRQTRDLVGQWAAGHDFLNLFCYTASATVYAAKGGANSSTSVDLSSTYLAWAKQNLELNGIRGTQHRLIRDDCLRWIRGEKRRYGLIYLEPPTFSASKRMQGTLDIQRDHVQLIRDVARLLTPDGILLFATNCRGFRLDADALSGLALKDLSRSTLPADFARSPRMHHVWRIESPPDR